MTDKEIIGHVDKRIMTDKGIIDNVDKSSVINKGCHNILHHCGGPVCDTQ